MKQICIIGLGRFGSHLARTLAKMDCEVLAIDTDENSINAIRDFVQRAVIMDARSLEALESIISPEMDDVVVSLAQNIEASIICTLHLKQIGVKNIHAKASSEDHATILRALGATNVIFPEWRIAEQMAQRLVNPNILDLFPLTQGYEVAEIKVPGIYDGRTISQLDLRKEHRVFIAGLKDPNSDQLDPMPPASSVLHKGTVMLVIGRREDLGSLRQEILKNDK